MNADVDVRQLCSDSWRPQAYLNVEHTEAYISVWGCHLSDRRITILGFRNYVFQLFQFENIEYYREWLDEHGADYNKIIELKDIA